MKRLNRVRILSAADKQLLLDLKNTVLRYLPGATVILYGSSARGQRGPESDMDVLVLSDRKLSSKEEERVDSAVYDLELECGIVLSVVFHSKAEWSSPVLRQSPYYENVMSEGVLV